MVPVTGNWLTGSPALQSTEGTGDAVGIAMGVGVKLKESVVVELNEKLVAGLLDPVAVAVSDACSSH